MKKTILSIAAVALTAAYCLAQQVPQQNLAAGTNADNPNAPIITFETDVIDYGKIEYGAEGTREFKFKNTGKDPLIITSATGSCGCTVPTAPKDPIKQGETSVIKVHYDTKRVGAFEKKITVVSNASTPTKMLTIKGEVKPDPNAQKPAVAPTNTTAQPK